MHLVAKPVCVDVVSEQSQNELRAFVQTICKLLLTEKYRMFQKSASILLSLSFHIKCQIPLWIILCGDT